MTSVVPAFTSLYIGIATALGAGVIEYLPRRKVLGRKTTGKEAGSNRPVRRITAGYYYLHPRRVFSNYLLSVLARCGTCGKALIGQEAKGGRFVYYVCGTLLKKGAGTCDAPYLNSRKFEDIVLDKIK